MMTDTIKQARTDMLAAALRFLGGMAAMEEGTVPA